MHVLCWASYKDHENIDYSQQWGLNWHKIVAVRGFWKKHRLRAFDSGVLGRICYKEELHNLYSSTSIIMAFKSK
jgi:hypothetical protein